MCGAGNMMEGWPKFCSGSPDIIEALTEFVGFMTREVMA